jgi:hypothetical protein
VVRSDEWERTTPGFHQGREPHQERWIPHPLSFISAVGPRGRPHLAGRGACGLLPPLTISDAELDEGLSVLDGAIRAVCGPAAERQLDAGPVLSRGGIVEMSP